MKFSYAQPSSQGRDIMADFRGLNKTLSVGDGEFTDMLNMTGDHYPVLSPRPKRLKLHTFTKCNGIYGKTHLLWVDGTDLYYNGSIVPDVMLADSEKQFVGMGAYVLIFPDAVVFNTEKVEDGVKSIAVSFTAPANVSYMLCDVDGKSYDYQTGALPESPTNGMYWLDMGGEKPSLKRYSELTKEWVAITTTMVKITISGITDLDKVFRQHDGITISGSTDNQFNTDHIIHFVGTDYIVVTGIIEQDFSQELPVGETPTFKIERKVPSMQFFTECNNRVWGCSSEKHEIYACRLGDPFNWYAYEGISSDSYAATVGTDGNFTGAATFDGCPIFFKERHIHKIIGSIPANFSVTALNATGVQAGSHRSICQVAGRLLYKGTNGVIASDGTTPTEVSYALGNGLYKAAVGGYVYSKYYLSMQDETGAWSLFVLDMKSGLWHREDATQVRWFTICGTDTFFVTGNVLWSITRGDKALAFNEAEEGYVPADGSTPAYVSPLAWSAETGDILWMEPDKKHIERFTLKFDLSANATLAMHVQYDAGGTWKQIFAMSGDTLRSTASIPFCPMRCDYFRIRLSGVGDVKIYGLMKTYSKGSDA